MEKELNIAEILKDKPNGIQLFDLLHCVKVKLDRIEFPKNNEQEAIQKLKENEDYFSEITDISIELDDVLV